MLVVDASVALAWGLPDERSPFADQVLDAIAETGSLAPSLWIPEVLNGALAAERRKRLSGDEAEALVMMIEALHRRRIVKVVDLDAGHALAQLHPLARTLGISAYDAVYLLLARIEALPLATLDGALARAAKQAGVQLWESA